MSNEKVGADGRCGCGDLHPALAVGSACPIGPDGRILLISADDYRAWRAAGGRWLHEGPSEPAPDPRAEERASIVQLLRDMADEDVDEGRAALLEAVLRIERGAAIGSGQ